MTLAAVALPGVPEIRRGDDLAALLHDAAARLPEPGLLPGDVLAVAHKAVAKAEGRVVPLSGVLPGAEARRLAAEHGKDPRLVELILSESAELVRADAGRLIARTHHGFVCANAGVDQSNAGGEEHAVLLPVDPDASARALRAALGCAVVVTDSFGRAWRIGQAEVAIGCAGLGPLDDWRGRVDTAGRLLHATRHRDRRRGRLRGRPRARQGQRRARRPAARPRAPRAAGRRPRRRGPAPRAGAGPVRLSYAATWRWDCCCWIARRMSNRSRAASTCAPRASDQLPSARIGAASVAPSGVSA